MIEVIYFCKRCVPRETRVTDGNDLLGHKVPRLPYGTHEGRPPVRSSGTRRKWTTRTPEVRVTG